MKSLWGRVGVILIGLLLFGYVEVWGADWKYLLNDGEGMVFYDVTRITRPSKNIVRVWRKLEYTDKAIVKYVREFGNKMENLSHSVGLDEINCSDRKKRNLSLTYYSKKGTVLYTSYWEGEWSYIAPDSIGEALYKAVCR